MIVVVFPGKQRRIFSQQLPETLDVVVVNDAPGLCDGPLQTRAETCAHLGGEVLPACEAVLTRNHELGVSLGHGKVHFRQMRTCTCDGAGVTGSDVAREFLCLFTEGLERRTDGERLDGVMHLLS